MTVSGMCHWSIMAFLSLACISCTGGVEYGSVSIHARYVPAHESYPLKRLSLPQGADTVVLTITGTDFSPIVHRIGIAANPSGTTVGGIPSGENRCVGIDIKDAHDTVIARGKTSGVTVYAGRRNAVDVLITQTGVFTRLATGLIPRAFALPCPLPDGTYMIMGGAVQGASRCGQGCVQLDATAQTELYDPRTGTFRQGPGMTEPRVFFTANVLPDGSVAVAGGTESMQIRCGAAACSIVIPGDQLKSSIEVYDQRSNSFYKAQTMAVPRAGHSAQVLKDSVLLVSGGIGAGGKTNSAERINLRSSEDIPYTMTAARAFHTTVVFADESVFLAGGADETTASEFFQQEGFTASDNITCPAFFASSLWLPATREIVLNGGFDTAGMPASRFIIADPVQKNVLGYYSMSSARALFSDVLLGDGTLLVAGGVTTPLFTATASSEVFSPGSRSFVKSPYLSVPRAAYAVQELQDGSALFTGGFSSIDTVTGDTTFPGTAELYNP